MKYLKRFLLYFDFVAAVGIHVSQARLDFFILI